VSAAIVIKEGPLGGQRVELESELVIGREDASLTVEDPELSRRHAVIRPIEDGVEIEDLGSLNGTFVNDRRTAGLALRVRVEEREEVAGPRIERRRQNVIRLGLGDGERRHPALGRDGHGVGRRPGAGR